MDVLSSDPVHPAMAGSAFLYSEECFRGAVENKQSQRNNQPGALCQRNKIARGNAAELRMIPNQQGFHEIAGGHLSSGNHRYGQIPLAC